MLHDTITTMGSLVVKGLINLIIVGDYSTHLCRIGITVWPGLSISVMKEGRAPLGGGAPERGNPPEGVVVTLPTTSSGWTVATGVSDLAVSWIGVWPLFERGAQW